MPKKKASRCYVTRAASKAAEMAEEEAKASAPSPTTKKYMKLQNRVMQDIAFEELMILRGNNNRSPIFGDIKKFVEKFQGRGYAVKRHHLEYRMKLG